MRLPALLLLGAAAIVLGNGSPLLAQPSLGESPADTLARNVRILARHPTDVRTLLSAGKAALGTGDAAAAAGFFGRAADAEPQNAAAHAGLGATLVALGQPRPALSELERARDLGAAPAAIGADMGLAYDLLGDQPSAQARYRAVLDRNGNQARERLALSLAISGDTAAAMATLQPLVGRDERAAHRIEAFILALSGNLNASKGALDALAPGAGASAEPYLRRLPSLTAAEKAAALNLGLFPSRFTVGEASRPDVQTTGDPATAHQWSDVVPPMEYGANKSGPAPSAADQKRAQQLALYGIFPEP